MVLPEAWQTLTLWSGGPRMETRGFIFKMRYLLLLHGSGQTGELMQKKISKLFTKEAWSQYTVLAPNGPYLLEGSDAKGWWPLESPQMYCQPLSRS